MPILRLALLAQDRSSNKAPSRTKGGLRFIKMALCRIAKPLDSFFGRGHETVECIRSFFKIGTAVAHNNNIGSQVRIFFVMLLRAPVAAFHLQKKDVSVPEKDDKIDSLGVLVAEIFDSLMFSEFLKGSKDNAF